MERFRRRIANPLQMVLHCSRDNSLCHAAEIGENILHGVYLIQRGQPPNHEISGYGMTAAVQGGQQPCGQHVEVVAAGMEHIRASGNVNAVAGGKAVIISFFPADPGM